MASLVSLEDFSDRLPGGIGSADTARAQAALDDASTLVRSEGGTVGATWGVGAVAVPDVAKMVCIAAAKRVFLNPDGVRAESIDSYTTTYFSSDVYLTAPERQAVRRVARKSGVWTLATSRTEDAADAVMDVPAIVNSSESDPPMTEELDPFGEGWS